MISKKMLSYRLDTIRDFHCGFKTALDYIFVNIVVRK